MKRWANLVVICLTSAAAWAQTKPENLSVSTWVREDVFAGVLVGDMDTFEKGVKKLDTHLAANPDSSEALAWMGLTRLVRAARANEAGDPATFKKNYDAANELFARAGLAKNEAVFAVTGGSFSVLAERLPVEVRRNAYERAYENYSALKALQAPYFDKLPTHMRGEVLAGLAQAAERIGKAEESKRYLAQIVETLPGTPYESRAKKWMDKPELSKTVSLTCQTCHDSGRLQTKLTASK